MQTITELYALVCYEKKHETHVKPAVQQQTAPPTQYD